MAPGGIYCEIVLRS